MVVPDHAGRAIRRGDVVLAFPSLTADVLLATVQWPMIPVCDGSTEVAMLQGGPGAEAVTAGTEDYRKVIITAGGVSWGLGHLGILLSARGDAVVSVIDVQQLIFQRSAVQPLWMYTPQGGCGDIRTRKFELDLDANKIVDAGIDGSGDADAAVRSTPLGQAFTVSRTDPARIMVFAQSCAGAYEWGLRITYVVDGAERHLDVGTPQQPFRSAGVKGVTVPAYTLGGGNEGLTRAGLPTKPFAC